MGGIPLAMERPTFAGVEGLERLNERRDNVREDRVSILRPKKYVDYPPAFLAAFLVSPEANQKIQDKGPRWQLSAHHSNKGQHFLRRERLVFEFIATVACEGGILYLPSIKGSDWFHSAQDNRR
jgi:hypothetical protein